MNATQLFAQYLVNTTYDDLPAEAVEAVKKEIIDSLATAIGGSSKAGIRELVDIVKEWGGRDQSAIIGYDLKCPAPHAAQVNGTMIHALDYDDGHREALVHIGCVAVSTCFAMAERMGGVSGKELIATMALGGDFESRLGLAIRPVSGNRTVGWHPTTLFGVLGSAVMAGKLLHLDQDRMINAMGLAYHQCSGSGSGVSDGALAKRMGPGLASRAGITAALMAERGITGARDPLEGPSGLFNIYFNGNYDPQKLTSDLGKNFEGARLDFKRYPCCGFTHAFINAALFLKSKYNIRPEHIQEVIVYAGETAYGFCQPLEIKRSPRNIVDAQFSVPWTVAVALVKGNVTLEDFSPEGIKNPAVLSFAPKITALLDPGLNRHGVSPARISMLLKNRMGEIEKVEAFHESGETPLSFEECSAKFRDCASFSIKPLTPGVIDDVIGSVDRLEKLDDAGKIIGLLG
ncbi:MAG: MmgE/PrpD family protein [Dehalococcoidales bacterium]|nr:MmgE/PrpD family protein [Dehalococcoidales bacterium]